jgi:hypothetical protein
MQTAIALWCNLIGVTDPTSIQIATGVAGGGTALLVTWIAFVAMLAILKSIGVVMRDL